MSVRPVALRSRLSRRNLLVMLSVPGALAACAAGAPKPASVEGSVSASADLNPSVTNRPSPLLIRVYELRLPTAFNQADFMALYQSDQSVLGPELLAREEIMLQPGESRPLRRQLHPDTRFIGVVGAYRNLEKASWRSVAAVQPGRSQRVLVRAEALAVSISVPP